MALNEAGLLEAEIGRRLGLSRFEVTEALDAGFARAGRERPDGRTRRIELTAKQTKPRKHELLADRVKALADQGLLFEPIGAELGVNRQVVRKAWAYWHTSRGLPVPDGRRGDCAAAARAARARAQDGDHAAPRGPSLSID